MGGNVDIVRSGFDHFAVMGDLLADIRAPEFVWDMSHFSGWPEEQTYDGIEGARRFLRKWIGAWDDWELEVESMHDAGDQVVVIARQRGRSKEAGLRAEMVMAMVFTLRDGKQTRMEMYSDPAEAMRAAGLKEQSSAPR
jgi:ketosteroid isomerase-like protein